MTDQPMTEDRRAEIHEALDSIEGRLVSVAHGITVAELRTVLELSRLAIRHEAVCERRTQEREDARHGMKIARVERDAAQIEGERLRAKISELEDTLAATLENWEAYAAELGPEPEAGPGTKSKPDRRWILAGGKTTRSGKLLFKCSICGVLDPAPTKDHECLDRDLECLECDEVEPHRWQPSPDAGPGWRCSICGEITSDDTPIPPPAPGECAECRASPGHRHHPDCSMSEGEPVPAESLPIKLPPQGES